ncbi:MAG TPA: hypothetical protein VN664_01295 [Burkholderiales bacterium]|jgi:hypothetical protein|nr:hypothetical protein [Burkholderiales bacterium]
MTRSGIAVRLSLLLAASLAQGCSSLLPRSESETEAPWKSFAEVKRIYDSIEPGRTTLEELKQLGYDQDVDPNVTVLNYTDVLTKFAPNAVRDEYLEPGIRECIHQLTKCQGYAVDHRQVRRDRVGNFFLDVVNFKRRTAVTGWKFGAVVVVVDSRVVHKSWTGVPAISEVEQNMNPLGPLQDTIGSLIPMPN